MLTHHDFSFRLKMSPINVAKRCFFILYSEKITLNILKMKCYGWLKHMAFFCQNIQHFIGTWKNDGKNEEELKNRRNSDLYQSVCSSECTDKRERRSFDKKHSGASLGTYFIFTNCSQHWDKKEIYIETKMEVHIYIGDKRTDQIQDSFHGEEEALTKIQH